jgi:homopolymeric O-antigen transport system permease protein
MNLPGKQRAFWNRESTPMEAELTSLEQSLTLQGAKKRAAHSIDADRQRPLPAKPLITIRAGRSARGLEVTEFWRHRDLLYFLAWRDVKIRYKQTALGAAWAILQPLLTMLVFTILFGRLARLPSENEPYAIFSYAGLLPWNFFSSSVTNSSNSLVTSANLITKVYFPRILVPTAAVGAALVDFAIAALMLFVIMPVYHVGFHRNVIFFLPLAMLTVLTAAAVGIWTSALNVKYRDVRYALPFALQLWMFLTPIIYPVSFLPPHWRWLLRLNPLSGIIEGFRDAIFGRPLNLSGLAVSTVITLVLLGAAAFIFHRMEKEFADVI